MEPRLASGEDAQQLALWHKESFDENAWSEEQIRQSLSNRVVRGWIIDRTGFILAQFANGEAEILTFCISPQARRKGGGAALLATVVHAADREAIERIFLEVAADNEPALRLYQKMHFASIGRRKNYYRRGSKRIDAILLARAL